LTHWIINSTPCDADGVSKNTRAKKHMFPQGAFVKMYYFAIEAREGVGYTLAALRCEVRIFENQQLANSNWQLAKATALPQRTRRNTKGLNPTPTAV